MINIASIFAKSPFKPLRDHMDKVVESVIPLNDFFEALFQQDYSKLEKIQQQVIQAENEADSIKNEVRNNLPRNIFMPINRRDLLEMLDMQDSIADVAQDIVILLNIRNMKLPEELSQDVIQFVKKSQDVCYLARGLTQEFGDVIESGFGRHEIKKLLQMIDNVSIAETEADNLEDALVRRLYEVEEKMNVRKILGFTNVSIRTNNEVAFSDKALYNKNTGICKLFGNVKLQKGSSFLTGDYAEVDMNKGISKLLPAPNLDNFNENRVRALIDKTENYETNKPN